MSKEAWISTLAITTIVAGFTAFTLHKAFPLPNEAWKAQRVQAEQGLNSPDLHERERAAQRLRVLDFVRRAGTLRYPPEWQYGLAGTLYHQSCCGEADAYEADDLEVDKDGNLWAILTCNDPDDCTTISGKMDRPVGSRFLVPSYKVLVNENPVNNTGHGWVWISPTSTNADGTPFVYCFTFGELN